jgi:hypothetical protein
VRPGRADTLEKRGGVALDELYAIAAMPEEPSDRVVLDGVERLGDSERKRVQDALSKVVESQRLRIEYAESRRGALATVGGVVLAAGLAGVLVVANSQNWTYFPAWLGLLCVTVSLVFTGVVVLVIYGRQTNWNYPFKPLTKTWKHFYRDAIPGAGDPKVPWYAGQSTEFTSASEQRFADIFPGYLSRVLSLQDSGIDLSQDIAQSYVLHWNEMYKNRFLTSLRRLLVIGIVCSVGLGIGGFFVGLIFAPNRFQSHKTAGTQAALPRSPDEQLLAVDTTS